MKNNKLIFNPCTLDLYLRLNDNRTINLNSEYQIKDDSDLFRVNRFRIEISLACDLKCDYCIVFMNNISKPTKLLSLETAKKIVDKFNSTLGDKGDIVLLGGEPLLNWEVVRYIIENNEGNTLLFTNALKLTAEKRAFLKEHNIRILTSMDGYTPQHNQYRFHSSTMQEFEITCDNIRNAIAEGCDVGIACLVHNQNVKELLPITNFFVNSLNCRSFSFAYSHFLLNKTQVSTYPFNQYIESICELFDYSKKEKIYIDQTGRLLRGILKKEKCLVGCKAGTSQRTFYPDGTETICTKLDLIGKGNIQEMLSIFPMNNPQCADCIALNLCGGGCLWDAMKQPNEKGVDERLCISKKAIIQYLLDDIQQELKMIDNEEEAKIKIDNLYYPIM
jgi:radical SAM protein with 4Fe4S-binding SPASM domain